VYTTCLLTYLLTYLLACFFIFSLCRLDRLLHQCVFDRKYSLLPYLADNLLTSSNSATNEVLHKDVRLKSYSMNFNVWRVLSIVNCGVLGSLSTGPSWGSLSTGLRVSSGSQSTGLRVSWGSRVQGYVCCSVESWGSQSTGLRVSWGSRVRGYVCCSVESWGSQSAGLRV